MRLKSIKIEGFRGFTKSASIDLDADVILLQGPNGVGKTSLLDAILWALTGGIARFSEKNSVISLYAREKIARVQLYLRINDQEVNVTRANDGERETIRLCINGNEHEGSVAERYLADMLLPRLKENPENVYAIHRVFTRGIYLQQDLVRQFIDTDTSAERYKLIGEVIGAGAVLDLQATLEKSRRQWAGNITSLKKESFDPLKLQLERIDDQLKRLENDNLTFEQRPDLDLSSLYSEAVELLGKNRLSLGEAPNNPTNLDRFLKEIEGERTSIERELSTIISLRENALPQVERLNEIHKNLLELEAEEQIAHSKLNSCDLEIEKIFEQFTTIRAKRLTDLNRINRLSAMAKLALEELTDVCPVCQQKHGRAATERHLHELISASTDGMGPVEDEGGRLIQLNTLRAAARAELENVRNRVLDLRNGQQEIISRQSVFNIRLRDIGVPEMDNPEAWLSEREQLLKNRLTRVTGLLQRGETLTLSVIRRGEQLRRSELQKERDSTQLRINDLNIELQKLETTHALAGDIIEGLRKASLQVTRRQIERVQPLFQRIYSRIDPHPTFRITQIIAEIDRGRGLIEMGVSDPDEGEQIHSVLPLLSSSQLNSFAVSLFLALNLGLTTLQLDLVMLDDPLQSLDSINLLGVVDVLRRFREHRQIVLSTHESRLLGLLQRKLRPVRPSERMITHYFESWTRDGPAFRSVASEFAPGEVRVLVA